MVRSMCRVQDDTFSLVFENLPKPLHQAATDLGFGKVGGDFCRTFPKHQADIVTIGANFERYGERMLRQTARLDPVPWQAALRRWLARLAHQPIHWWLVGSAALAVRGIAVEPRDFDIVTDDAGAHQLGALFHNDLIEPVVPVDGWMCRWFGRAFLDARFEWVGAVDERADTPDVSDYGPIAAQQAEHITWEGHQIVVPPVQLQLIVSERRGLTERVARIRQYLESYA